MSQDTIIIEALPSRFLSLEKPEAEPKEIILSKKFPVCRYFRVDINYQGDKYAYTQKKADKMGCPMYTFMVEQTDPRRMFNLIYQNFGNDPLFGDNRMFYDLAGMITKEDAGYSAKYDKDHPLSSKYFRLLATAYYEAIGYDVCKIQTKAGAIRTGVAEVFLVAEEDLTKKGYGTKSFKPIAYIPFPTEEDLLEFTELQVPDLVEKVKGKKTKLYHDVQWYRTNDFSIPATSALAFELHDDNTYSYVYKFEVLGKYTATVINFRGDIKVNFTFNGNIEKDPSKMKLVDQALESCKEVSEEYLKDMTEEAQQRRKEEEKKKERTKQKTISEDSTLNKLNEIMKIIKKRYKKEILEMIQDNLFEGAKIGFTTPRPRKKIVVVGGKTFDKEQKLPFEMGKIKITLPKSYLSKVKNNPSEYFFTYPLFVSNGWWTDVNPYNQGDANAKDLPNGIYLAWPKGSTPSKSYPVVPPHSAKLSNQSFDDLYPDLRWEDNRLAAFNSMYTSDAVQKIDEWISTLDPEECAKIIKDEIIGYFYQITNGQSWIHYAINNQDVVSKVPDIPIYKHEIQSESKFYPVIYESKYFVVIEIKPYEESFSQKRPTSYHFIFKPTDSLVKVDRGHFLGEIISYQPDGYMKLVFDAFTKDFKDPKAKKYTKGFPYGDEVQKAFDKIWKKNKLEEKAKASK